MDVKINSTNGFIVVVEEVPRMEFRVLHWEGSLPPDILIAGTREYLKLDSHYAGSSNRFRYSRATICSMV